MNRTLGGNNYKTTGNLDAFSQLHVARRLGPAIPIIQGMVKPENAGKDKAILTVLMLAHVSEEATDYLLKKCLSVVVREQPGGQYAKIQSPTGALMFDDISMHDVMELLVAVIEENLGDFFRTALEQLDTEKAG